MQESQARVLANKNIARGIFEVRLAILGERQPIGPGQFVHLRIPNAPHLLLRRPISVFDYDFASGELTLIYQVVGEGTRYLSFSRENDVLSLLWPLGNGFSVPDEAQRIAAVGGGIGIAPLHYALKDINCEKRAFLGYRSAEYAYAVQVFEGISSVALCTDDGTLGARANSVKLLENAIEEGYMPELVLACGPMRMLSALKTLVIKHGIRAQFSLEERMGCGIGACLVCSCKTRGDDGALYKRVCADGPVFDAREVCLDE